ncbi:MAG: phosphopyruvate hydratase, partial [Patescibacteria group bacterium]
DNDKARYGGKGVLKAIEHVNLEIKQACLGFSVDQLPLIDQRRIDLDGTGNKARLGANAILGVSLAAARVGALEHNLPLYKFIRQCYKMNLADYKMPVPLVNVVNGGAHADNNLDFQEFWIIPQNIKTIKERIRAVSEIFHTLGKIFVASGYDTDVGNEGGYAPNFKTTNEVWQKLSQAVSQAGYGLGKEIFFGMDAGSSEFYDEQEKKYILKLENKNFSAAELSLVYQQWMSAYPFLALEDPFAQDDWDGWQKFQAQLLGINKNLLLIGDDLFTTNVARLRLGIEKKAANAILIKPNQIGTLTETMACIKLAQKHNFKIAVSHRSGETEDDFIADLAVAVNSDYIKTGAPSRSERVAKYNRLMEIESELG